MDLVVQLQLRDQPLGGSQNIVEGDGICIESADVQEWISAALESGYNLTACDFFPIARSDGFQGVFVRHGGAKGSVLSEMQSSRANVVWMGKANAESSPRSSQLWIPRHGVLKPRPKESDWEGLLAGQRELLVWHPALGLLGFDDSQRIGVESLIIVPDLASHEWSLAVQGTALPERLLRVDSPPPPSLQEWLDESGKQLGKPPKTLMDLPPSKVERRGRPIHNLMNRAKAVFGKAVHRLFDESANKSSKSAAPGRSLRKPSALSNSEWVKKIRQWASKQMEQWNETLEARRHASVNRLMEMLEKDPEQGLRYAIPMGDTGLGRGLSSPGADLVERDWSTGSSSGGADYWSLKSSLQMRLRARYLELAQREIANGRFERGAFIYAKLLGDYLGAAKALEQGKFYRQAALIYRDRLSHKQKAAELFRLIGDFDETLILYTSMGMHLQAGDLYQMLGQQEKATKCYYDYVEECRSRSRWCEAADVLTGKLGQVDSAIAMLQSNWPNGHQGRKCLEKTMSILREFHRSDECAAQIDQLLLAPNLLDCGSWPADFLADLVQSHQEPHLAEHARQSLYRLSSRMLNSEMHLAHQSAIGIALRKAIPEDRLLHRDTLTFIEQEAKKRNPPIRRDIIHRPHQLQSTLTMNLAADTEWFGALLTNRGPLCFGDRDGTLLIQSAWQEKPVSQGTESKTPSGMFEIRSFFGPGEQRRWMSFAGGIENGVESFEVILPGKPSPHEFGEWSSYWYDGLLRFNILPCNGTILDCFVSPEDKLFKAEDKTKQAFFLRKNGTEITIGNRAVPSIAHFPAGRLMADFRSVFDQSEYSDLLDNGIEGEVFDELISAYLCEQSWRIALHSKETLVACGNKVNIYRLQSLIHEVDLPNPIETIFVPAATASGRAILGLTTGVALQWLSGKFRFQMIDELASHARSCFLSTGQIAIAHDGGIDVYSLFSDRFKLELSLKCDRNYAAIVADDKGGFWTLSQQGLAQYWNNYATGP